MQDLSLDQVQVLEKLSGIERLKGTAAQCRKADSNAATHAISQDLELIGDFVHEAREHVDSIDGHLLAFEEDRNGKDAIDAIPQLAHDQASGRFSGAASYPESCS